MYIFLSLLLSIIIILISKILIAQIRYITALADKYATNTIHCSRIANKLTNMREMYFYHFIAQIPCVP